MIGLCGKTSPLYSRCVRLSILMLGILTDLVICALFFSLDATEEESFYFWDSLVENIWVSFFSVLFSIPPTLLVVLAFNIPSSVIRSFERSSSVSELEQVYRKNSQRLCCRRALGFFLFFIASSILCLYLIGFGIAHVTLQKNWVQSSGVSVAIDLVVFELIPAMAFGWLGLMIVWCKCNCCLWMMMWLDVYRFFRNIAA